VDDEIRRDDEILEALAELGALIGAMAVDLAELKAALVERAGREYAAVDLAGRPERLRVVRGVELETR